MTTMHRLAAAFAAVGLVACAHSSAPSPSSPSYLGGRAGQPGGWMASAETTRIEDARQVAWNDPQLGGRSAQPASWIATGTPAPVSTAPAYCYAGGRDAQPFSGPSLRLSSQHAVEPAPLCEHGAVHNGRL